jgi:hypothetical protein
MKKRLSVADSPVKCSLAKCTIQTPCQSIAVKWFFCQRVLRYNKTVHLVDKTRIAELYLYSSSQCIPQLVSLRRIVTGTPDPMDMP